MSRSFGESSEKLLHTLSISEISGLFQKSFGRRNAGFLNPPVAKNNIESGRGG
jgi:hypothetical protein